MRLVQNSNDLVGEVVWSGRLSNGLSIYVIPRQGYAKKYATFSVHYGSVDNEFVHPETGEVVKVPEGIAHFLEHKMFEEEEGNIFEQFSELGADANAYTDFTITSYLFSTTENFEKCLDTLMGFVSRPYFTDENVEKEKGIIQQEIRMYEDLPGHQVTQNLLKALYHFNPVRYDIAGTIDSIRRITKEMLYTCYETFYHPSNMSILVAGGVDPKAVFEQVETFFASKGFKDRPPIKRMYPQEPRDVLNPRVSRKMSVSMPLLELGFKDTPVPAGGTELLKKDLITSILLEMMFGKGSDLFTELYDQGLIDDKFGASFESEQVYSAVIVGGPTRDPSRLEEEILKALSRDDLISEDGFKRAHNKLVGSFVALFNSPERLAYNFNDYYFKGIEVFDYLRVLEKIDFHDVCERRNELFSRRDYAVSVVSPID